MRSLLLVWFCYCYGILTSLSWSQSSLASPLYLLLVAGDCLLFFPMTLGAPRSLIFALFWLCHFDLSSACCDIFRLPCSVVVIRCALFVIYLAVIFCRGWPLVSFQERQVPCWCAACYRSQSRSCFVLSLISLIGGRSSRVRTFTLTVDMHSAFRCRVRDLAFVFCSILFALFQFDRRSEAQLHFNARAGVRPSTVSCLYLYVWIPSSSAELRFW